MGKDVESRAINGSWVESTIWPYLLTYCYDDELLLGYYVKLYFRVLQLSAELVTLRLAMVSPSTSTLVMAPWETSQ